MKRITFWNSGYKLNKKSAMTLVEVLITLLIIGVVAAFTIPIIFAIRAKTEKKGKSRDRTTNKARLRAVA